MKSLWRHLRSCGLPTEELAWIWNRIKDLVIKSVLSGLSGLREEFKRSHESRYNCYKLLGYDIMLDSTLVPHLLEINSRPSVYTDLLDQAVNQPMVEEMFRIVGYHLPPDILTLPDHQLEQLSSLLGVSSVDKLRNMTFCDDLYNKIFTKQDLEKQLQFSRISEREEWIETITNILTPSDIKHLIKSEEELNSCSEFDRIFPTHETHKYFSFFDEVTYYDKLLDGVETNYHQSRGDLHRDINWFIGKHFPEGFGAGKYSPPASSSTKTESSNKEFRKSYDLKMMQLIFEYQ